MATKRITIEVDASEYDQIAKTFGATSDADKTRKASAFAANAWEEYFGWIAGTKRLRSLSELQVERIAALYQNADLVEPEESPTFERLYNDFHLAHGQALYACRVLFDQNLAKWRGKAREEIKRSLAAVRQTARTKVDRGDAQTTIAVTVSKLGGVELKQLFDNLWNADHAIILPQPGIRFGNAIGFDIPASTVLALLNHPELQ